MNENFPGRESYETTLTRFKSCLDSYLTDPATYKDLLQQANIVHQLSHKSGTPLPPPMTEDGRLIHIATTIHFVGNSLSIHNGYLQKSIMNALKADISTDEFLMQLNHILIEAVRVMNRVANAEETDDETNQI